MFTKSNKEATKAEQSKASPPSPAKAAAPTLISKDLRIIGDLQSEGEVQIDGSVEGDIRSQVLLIGESAHITGEIVTDSVIVHGMVKGHIKSREVKLARTAHVIGDILHEDLAIETGAFLEGHCKRIQGQTAPKIEFHSDPTNRQENVPKPGIQSVQTKTNVSAKPER